MKKKIKILFPLTWYYPIGGIETFAVNLISELKKEFDIVVAVSFKLKRSEINLGNVRTIVVESSIMELEKVMDQEKPDIVYVNNSMPFDLSTVKLAKRKGIKTIVEFHRMFVSQHKNIILKEISDKLLRPAAFKFKINMAKYADQVIFPSIFVKNQFRKFGYKGEGKVIYNGVPLKFRPISDQQKDKLRRKFEIFNGEQVILWVGRFDWVKNPTMFIEAAKVLMGENAIFLMVGFGIAPQIKLMIKNENLENFRFLGYTEFEKIHEIYQLADVFVSTSKFETLGNTILEAAACGLTTVAPDHTGAKEAGIEGYLYRYNQDELNKTIKEAIKKPKLAKYVLTVEETSKEIEKVIKRLVEK